MIEKTSLHSCVSVDTLHTPSLINDVENETNTIFHCLITNIFSYLRNFLFTDRSRLIFSISMDGPTKVLLKLVRFVNL